MHKIEEESIEELKQEEIKRQASQESDKPKAPEIVKVK